MAWKLPVQIPRNAWTLDPDLVNRNFWAYIDEVGQLNAHNFASGLWQSDREQIAQGAGMRVAQVYASLNPLYNSTHSRGATTGVWELPSGSGWQVPRPAGGTFETTMYTEHEGFFWVFFQVQYSSGLSSAQNHWPGFRVAVEVDGQVLEGQMMGGGDVSNDFTLSPQHDVTVRGVGAVPGHHSSPGVTREHWAPMVSAVHFAAPGTHRIRGVVSTVVPGPTKYITNGELTVFFFPKGRRL